MCNFQGKPSKILDRQLQAKKVKPQWKHELKLEAGANQTFVQVLSFHKCCPVYMYNMSCVFLLCHAGIVGSAVADEQTLVDFLPDWLKGKKCFVSSNLPKRYGIKHAAVEVVDPPVRTQVCWGQHWMKTA